MEEQLEATLPKEKLKALQDPEESKGDGFSEGLNVTAVMMTGDQDQEVASTNNDENISDESIHPLLMNHILEKIFKSIIDPIRESGSHRPDVGAISRDVKSIRLVCKIWRDTATNVFRRARPIMDIGTEEISMKCSDFQLRRFLEAMKDSTMIPIQRFRINRSALIPQNRRLMMLFLAICGPEMVELHLSIRSSDLNTSFEIQEDDVSHIKLEKLFSFNIKISESFSWLSIRERQDGDVAQFIGFLFTITKNLRDFTMTNDEYTWDNEQSLSNGVQRFFGKLPSTLKSIKLYAEYNNFYLNQLQKNHIKLENFQFHSVRERFHLSGDETLYGFFEGQSQTLKELTVPAVCLAVTPESEKPIIFCQLRSLNLQIEHFPISFPDRFPKLAILDFSNLFREADCMELLSGTTPSKTVTELHLPCVFFGANTAAKMAKCFPSVRKLFLILRNNFPETNSFENILVYFSGIEELEVSLDYLKRREPTCGESFFCNVSSRDSISARANGNLDDFDPKMLQENPSILLLTKLKKLVLKDCNDIIFTDFAAHFLFLKMESLEELYIDSGFGNMSADYLGRLKSKVRILRRSI